MSCKTVYSRTMFTARRWQRVHGAVVIVEPPRCGTRDDGWLGGRSSVSRFVCWGLNGAKQHFCLLVIIMICIKVGGTNTVLSGDTALPSLVFHPLIY